MFSDDITIDLGTANTLVHVAGKGIVIDEPSLVAVRLQGAVREVLGVGAAARTLLTRSPDKLEGLRPLKDGVIADFAATEEMLRQFLKRTKTMLGFRRPRVLVCVPAGATPVERRAVRETVEQVGARKIYLVEEPVAAAIGAGLPIETNSAYLVVDIGGGTTDIAVLANGVVVQSRSLKCAGNAMDEAIVRYVRREHRLIVGEANAEKIKISAGTADATAKRAAKIRLKGRDLDTGAEKVVSLVPSDVAAALAAPVEEIADFIERAIGDLPANLATDVTDRGILLSGGGGQLHGLHSELERRLGLPVVLSPTPMHCVVKGAAQILADLTHHRQLLFES